jgi:PAS domain S-box-containing protein
MSNKPSYEELEKRIKRLESSENELKETIEELTKYQTIISSTPDGVSFLNEDYRYVIVNKAYERLSGIDRNKIVGLSVSEYLGKDVFQNFIKPKLDRCLKGEIVNYQEWFEYPKLGKIFMDITYYPYRTADNIISGVIATSRDITEGKLMEEELRDSEAKLRSFFEEAQDAIFVADAETGMILDANKAAQNILGRTLQEIMQMHQSQVVSFEEAEVGKERFKEILKEGHVGPKEYTIVSADGHRTAVEAKSNFLEIGNRKFVIAFFRDITLQKQSKEKLQQTNDLLQTIINSAPVAIIGLDLDGYVNSVWNPEAEKLLGWSAKEVMGRMLPSIPADRQEEFRRFNEQIRKGIPLAGVDVRRQRRNGNPIDFTIYASPLHDAKGNINGKIAVLVDITERKLVQEKLRESEAKYRSMMESITDQLYICSPEFKIEYMNPAMINRLGRDATGECCFSAIHGLDNQCDWCVFDEVKQGKAAEITLTSPLDGRTYRITDMPIQHQNGMVSKMSIYRDITRYLEAVAEKEKAQAQIQQLQKMESIGNLAGGIAHDFNNVLYPIIGFTQMSMEELPQTHPVQENLHDILDGAKRAQDMIKQILLFSRQREQVLTSVVLAPVVKETIKLLRSTIPTNIDIQTQLYDGKDTVLCDTTEIHKIVMNLCTNAYQAMTFKGDTIKVSLNKTEPSPDLNLPSGEYICLSISDNGSGIPDNIKDKIFEPYYTTKPVGKGTGMGLSVVYGIVKNYNGQIQVESRPEEGTTFNVFLPITTKTIKRELGQKNKSPEGGSERILLVDDEEAIIKLGVKVLGKLGYEVAGVQDSSEALKLFKSKPAKFNLVITDMAMPGMEGTILAQKISEIRPDIPIILCSGFSEKIDHEKAKRFNIQSYVDKPIPMNELTAKVRELLDKSSGDKNA